MIRRDFCHREAAGVEAAVESGWIPYFYDGDREVSEPACPSCTTDRLQYSDDGEWELADRIRTDEAHPRKD